MNWALALHVFGTILWVGALIGLSLILRSEAATKDSNLLDVGRKVARVMDVGGLLAIVCGIYILVRTKGLGEAWVLKQPWMHIKLTLVTIVVFGGHGFVEARLKKLRNGVGRRLPGLFAPVVILAAFAIVVLVVVRPLTKGG